MRAKPLLGWAAILCLAFTVNGMVWWQNPFSVPVLIGACAAIAAGLGWLVLVGAQWAARMPTEGRTIGGLNAALSSVLFLGICTVLYAFAASTGVSMDLTQEGRRELSTLTQQVLQNLDREVEVYCFFLNIDDELIYIARRKTEDFLERCERYTDQLDIEFIDPQRSPERLQALEVTHASQQGTVVIRAGERQRVVLLSGGSPRMEEREFTNALINVLRDQEPKVYFLAGHNERDPMDTNEQRGGSILHNLLVGESYAVEALTLSPDAAEIPPDCRLLIINNPRSDLRADEIAALDAYIDRGGRFLLMVDPWLRINATASGEQFRPWLEERLGVVVGSDIVITDQNDTAVQVVLGADVTPFQSQDEIPGAYQGSYSLGSPITQQFTMPMMLSAVRSVSMVANPPDDTAGLELLRATPDYWAETDVAKLAETGQAQQDSGEADGPHSLAVAVARLTPQDARGPGVPRESRAVIVGDADFASNGLITQFTGHVNFVLNAVAWLTESEDLIAIRPRDDIDPPLLLDASQKRRIAWSAILMTTQAAALAGVAMQVWRRRFQ